jgi:hypothetical protein
VATQAAFLFVYAVTPSIIGNRNLSPEPPIVNDQASSATATVTVTFATNATPR